MKNEQDPTTLEDVEKLLLQAALLTNHRHFVIGGSLCILGAVMHPPPSMVLSRDLDFYPKFDPGRGAIEIASQLSASSAFFDENGIYADPITPQLLSLPDGWETRLLQVPLKAGVVAWFIEPNDVVVGKLMRGEENDLRWTAAGIKEGVIDLEMVETRLGLTHRGLPEDFARAKGWIVQLRAWLQSPESLPPAPTP